MRMQTEFQNKTAYKHCTSEIMEICLCLL